MNPKFSRALFIFRRDLRLQDNTGLIFALMNAKEVICCFIFTPEQIKNNPYRSDHCLQFMLESLEDLEEQLKSKKGKLYLFWGDPKQVVAKCIKELSIDLVAVNRDYTPYSEKRDKEIENVCEKHGRSFYSFDDLLLHPLERTCKANKKPYTIFTPFYRNAAKLDVDPPLENRNKNYFSKRIPFAKDKNVYSTILLKRNVQVKGGRSAALQIIKGLSTFSDYSAKRDFPYENKTTHLSAHLKFTTCSIREVYYMIVDKLGKKSPLIRSLFWRDFFTGIAWHFPHVFKGAFQSKFSHLTWNKNKNIFVKWCQGKTGFPIVDAGMREMNQTGFMHNRARMIVASFLVKDLHINWRWGEKYFAKTLIDYDPCVNNGNWQWAASTGCDAQPYFRIFNPWMQSKRFDAKCQYIKYWLPELKELTAQQIHNWYLEKHRDVCPLYPAPIIDHSIESKKSISLYKKSIK